MTSPRPPAPDAPRRGRPPGKLLTIAESAVLLDWRDARLGSTADLSADLGVSRAHLSRFLNGSGTLSRPAWYAVLRLLRDESIHHMTVLDVKGSPDTQGELRAVRSIPTTDAPRAGRGRAVAVSLA